MSRRFLDCGLPRAWPSHKGRDGVAYRDYGLGVVRRYGLNPKDPSIAPALRDAGVLHVQLAHLSEQIARTRPIGKVLRLLGVARKLRGQRMAVERDLAKLAQANGHGQPAGDLQRYLAHTYGPRDG